MNWARVLVAIGCLLALAVMAVGSVTHATRRDDGNDYSDLDDY